MSTQPNVIVCQCDQLRAFEVGCYGNDVVRTPNLDRFADGGVRFDIAVANNPPCMPSRASLLSGQYARTCTDDFFPAHWRPGRMGDWPGPGRRGWFPDPTFAEIMRGHGYATALIGKWHIDADPQAVGFDYAMYPADPGHGYYGGRSREGSGEPIDLDGFAPDFDLATLERYLSGWEHVRPLFLYFNIPVPHMPLGPGNLPARYDNLYSPQEVPLRDNVWVNGELAHDDLWFDIYMGKAPAGFDLRQLTAAYYAATTCTDDLFGRMLDILGAAGVTDNAIVVFTSDHGDNLGSHHAFNKEGLLEEAVRIPMLISAPGIVPQADTTHVAQTIDVLPTVLDLCGIPTPSYVEGRSLAPVLRGDSAPALADAAFIDIPSLEMQTRDAAPMPTLEIGIRTSRYLVGMTLDADYRTIREERSRAYDLVADPLQMHNLARATPEQEWQRELRARLLGWHQSTPRLGGRGLSRHFGATAVER